MKPMASESGVIRRWISADMRGFVRLVVLLAGVDGLLVALALCKEWFCGWLIVLFAAPLLHLGVGIGGLRMVVMEWKRTSWAARVLNVVMSLVLPLLFLLLTWVVVYHWLLRVEVRN